MNDNTPIDTLNLSRKLLAVRNFELPEVQAEIEENPRLKEVLWFLSWISNPANFQGGLRKFTADFIASCRNKIGTRTMHEAAESERFSAEQIFRLWGELPSYFRESLGFDEWEGPASLVDPSKNRDRESAARVAKIVSPAALFEEVYSHAEKLLAVYFRDLCENPEETFSPRESWSEAKGAPWFWPGVCADLLEWMDRRAKTVLGRIADTRVAREIYKWIDRAQQCEMPVWLTGSCRFGKTESIKALADAYPGKIRVVQTPDDSSILSLCREIAKSLCIQSTAKTALGMKGSIEEVLAASGILLIFDEAHFLLPTRIGKTTRPQRLDWVRRNVIDRGLPAVFVSTPQSYLEARRKFERTTGYTMGQWDGRLLREEPIELPEEITEEEMMAVAAIFLPGYEEDYLRATTMRVAASRGSSVYAQISKVCKMAFSVARENGRSSPRLADIRQAAVEVLPAVPGTGTPAPSAPRQPGRTAMRREDLMESLPSIPSRGRINLAAEEIAFSK